MDIELRELSESDVEAHIAGEDEEMIRWLNGGRSTYAPTVAHFAMLTANLRRGAGKVGFGVWLDGRLAGYVDADPEVDDGLEPGQVNVAYGVYPWARGRRVASAAVELICAYLAGRGVGSHAALRVDPLNTASVKVAECSGFTFAREVVSRTDTRSDGTPATMRVYLRELSSSDREHRPDVQS